jgi:hypothetical protein
VQLYCNWIFAFLIEKDVLRTDRCLPFFKDVEGRGLILLKDILVTYGMYNFDLGLCLIICQVGG